MFQCFRDSALQWLENQLKFISLNDFKIAITKIFSFVELVANFDSIIINFSSQRRYHTCLECDVQFSSTSRFLAHTQKSCFKNFTCKHCKRAFASNNKFHEHVRLHHIKKNYNNKTLRQRFVEKKNSHINLSISRFISSITFKSMTTSTRSSSLVIFMTKAQIARSIVFSVDFSITSMNSVAFKSSRRHESTCTRFTFSITFRFMFASTKSSSLIISITKASVVCFFTFSSSSFRISILSHTTSKIHMFMNDLFEIFAEISNKKSKNIIKKKSISSCFSEFRHTRIKSLCQQNFKNTVMFAKKQFRKKWNIIHKRMRFSMFNQIQIINYFKFADQSNSTSIKSIKFNTFISCLNSTFRICFSINQNARTSQHQHIAIDETSSLETQQKLKFSIFSSRFSSTSRFCFSVNQIAETSQYQHIEIDKIKSLKSFKSIKLFKSLNSVAIISTFNSTFRFSLSINHDSLISSRIDFLRALIN